MRLTLIILALLPVAAQAQSTTEIAPTNPTEQSCALGMVWNSATGVCTAADQQSVPMQSTPSGSNCSHGGTKQVTS